MQPMHFVDAHAIKKQTSQAIPQWRIVQVTPVLCDSVAKWQEVVPVAAALRNPVLDRKSTV